MRQRGSQKILTCLSLAFLVSKLIRNRTTSAKNFVTFTLTRAFQETHFSTRHFLEEVISGVVVIVIAVATSLPTRSHGFPAIPRTEVFCRRGLNACKNVCSTPDRTTHRFTLTPKRLEAILDPTLFGAAWITLGWQVRAIRHTPSIKHFTVLIHLQAEAVSVKML